MMKQADALRLFGLTNLSIEADVRRVEVEQKVDFGHRKKRQQSGDEDFYKQFSVKLREEAEAMARHYVIFYCLENSIRELITARLRELHGETWWDQSVPQSVRENCKKNRDRELASGITVRSEYMIDYSTFGELGEILKANSETFGDMLRDLLVLLRHKRRRFDCRVQQGQRERFRAMATMSLRRIVAIEFGM
jgi:hypothetical protein